MPRVLKPICLLELRHLAEHVEHKRRLSEVVGGAVFGFIPRLAMKAGRLCCSKGRVLS
jgi:hypothetical protein